MSESEEQEQLIEEFDNCTIGSKHWKKFGTCNLDLYLETRKRCIKLHTCFNEKEHHTDVSIKCNV